jgi:PadR family transcriptional regulator AphA
MIRYILLGFLNYGQMTGYELKQYMDQSTGHFWHAHHSQIYTTLRQMEEEGLVTSQYIKGESQPDRRVYTIAQAGKDALKAWLDQTMTETTSVKEELLVRLFFSAQRDPQQVLTELRLQLELHKAKLEAYHVIAREMTADHQHGYPPMERDQHFWRLTLELGIRYEEVYNAWLQASIKEIETL